MADKTPEVFKYIRLMEWFTPWKPQWQYQKEDGSWVDATLDECLRASAHGAEYAQTNIAQAKQKREVYIDELPDVRHGKIEIDADEVEKGRIEKMISRVVTKVDEPLQELDLSKFSTWEDALSAQKEYIKSVSDFRDYVETCNSLRLLYNLLTPIVRSYLFKQSIIAGERNSVGGYGNITEYYNELSQCLNVIKRDCFEIIVSVENGVVIGVNIIGRGKKDNLNIPLLDKRTNIICRMSPDDWFKLMLAKYSDKDFKTPEINLSINAMTAYVDKSYKWENVRKMSFHYKRDSDYLYTFDELRNNIEEYLQDSLENGLRQRNKLTEELCQNLECLYRYITDNIHIEGYRNVDKSKSDIWEFICDLWEIDAITRGKIWRYFGLYLNKLPIEFIITN